MATEKINPVPSQNQDRHMNLYQPEPLHYILQNNSRNNYNSRDMAKGKKCLVKKKLLSYTKY